MARIGHTGDLGARCRCRPGPPGAARARSRPPPVDRAAELFCASTVHPLCIHCEPAVPRTETETVIQEVVTSKGANAITSDHWHVVHSHFTSGKRPFIRAVHSEHADSSECQAAAKD